MKGVFCAVFVGLAALGMCDVATFDDMSEGVAGYTFTDGGITFSYNDVRIDDGISTPPYVFCIEDATGNSSYVDAGFTMPNVLSCTGFGPGPGACASRLGEFWITPGEVSNHASLDFYGVGNGNTLVLEAYKDGQLLATTWVTPDTNEITKYTLDLGGTIFDSLRLTATGSADNSTVFGDIDNVNIQAVPEPATMSALALGGLALLRRRRRSSQENSK